MNQMVLDRVVAEDARLAQMTDFFSRPVEPVRTQHSGLDLVWNDDEPASVSSSRARNIQFALKRLADIGGAGLGLLLLFPLFAVIAVAIKLTSPGPVFFRQAREGRAGRAFQIYKFRSMSSERGDPTGVEQTIANDPRVTSIGRFIRRTSIDELPQLINVLWGDMSLVGPRPHVEGMLAAGRRYDLLVPYYAQRLSVAPGLTGWAQANGLRGPTSEAMLAKSRVDHDIAYIQNFSLLLDLRIVLMTIKHEFFGGSGV